MMNMNCLETYIVRKHVALKDLCVIARLSVCLSGGLLAIADLVSYLFDLLTYATQLT